MRPVFRLLPLPLCIALSLSAHAADDKPEDYSLCPIDDAVPVFADAQAPVGTAEQRAALPTDIDGDSVDGVNGQTVNFQGNVALKRGDQFLGTDKLTYDQETEQYVAEGNVRYQDSSMRLLAERATGDQSKDQHRVESVRYQLTEARGNGGASVMQMTGSTGRLVGSTYSTCPPNDRRWELRAQRIDIDTNDGFATARNATIRVGRIPVLYFPWFKFPIDSRRQTGLLFPTLGTSGRNGFDWQQPIYFNLAPNYDLTLTPRLMTRRGLLLDTEFRYLTETGRGVFDIGYLPSDRLTERERRQEIDEMVRPENRREDDRARFSFNGSQNLGPTWQARTNLNWISDPRYLEDLSSNLGSGSSFAISSDIGIYGRGRYWDAGLAADAWQLADYTFAESILPYNRVPRAYLHWEQPYRRWLSVGVDTEATRFQHTNSSTLAGGSRVDIKPYVSLPLEGASWFIKPTLAYRYTAYDLDDALANRIASDNNLASANTTPSRALPITTIDAGLFFDRNASIGGEGYLHTLEPRLFYVNTPYRDQTELPQFDTQTLTFGYGQLFRDNRFTGADRQADANQLTLALSSRLIREADGREKLSASIGQIRYFEDTQVVLNPRDPPILEGESAWIAESTYSPNDKWNISAAYQWDPRESREDLASLRLRYLMGDSGVVNFSYRYRRDRGTDLFKQADLSFLYPVSASWSLVGRYYYSLQDSQLLEGIAGVQWDSCCLAVRVVGRRYVRRYALNNRAELNNALQFEVELKGLGSAGTDVESRLRRAILGYYRDDLYLVPPAAVRSGTENQSPDPTP
ncbi:MAG: LPS-assembly protein LptD [Luteimonas sp.]